MKGGCPPPIPAQNIKELTVAIEPLEFDTTLKCLAQGLPGNDGIDANMLRALLDETLSLLRSSMSDLIVHQLPLPDSWKLASITLLPKDRPGVDPLNYWPISLLQVQYKWYTSIITTRLSKLANEYILCDGQMGFCKGMSSTMALHVVMEEAQLYDKELHVVYIDFKKAFDLLHQDAILQVLQHYRLGDQFIKLVKQLYEGCSATVQVNRTPSAPFLVEWGVQQGDTLSPLLFILAIIPT